MITPIECQERAAECRQMAARAPNPRVHAILTDMARTWTRLALEAELSQQENEALLPFTPTPQSRETAHMTLAK